MNGNRPEGRRQVPLYNRIDVLSGVVVCVAAIVIWMGSAGLPFGQLRHIGPGFLPRILAIALMAGGLALLVIGFTQPHEAAERLVLAFRGPAAVGLGILVFAVSIKGFALGPFRVPQFGLLVSGPLIVVIAGMGSMEASLRELVVLGVALNGLAVLGFVELLGMQVPVFPGMIADSLPMAWGPHWPRSIAALLYLILAFGLWRLFGLSVPRRDSGDPSS